MATRPGSKAAIMESLMQSPLGTGDGEGALQAPFNRSNAFVRVRARNMSAVQAREYVVEQVSYFRGGEETRERQLHDPKATGREVVSIEQLHRLAAMGRDANIKEVGVKPVDVMLQFDNHYYVLPALSDDGKEEAPWVDLPDGVYDLYVGNYQRLNSTNPRDRADELERVKMRRKDFVIRKGEKNPAAFLEFAYEILEPAAVAVDAERIYSGEVMEV